MKTAKTNIIKAIQNPKLFKPVFRDLKSWWSWLGLLKVFFGLALNKAELDLYHSSTGRKGRPQGEFKELWAIVGRRGGKSFISAVIAVYLALFFDYKKYLAPGESGVIQIIAADRAQAQVILKYIKGILNSNPVLFQYVKDELRERVDLTNGISIEVMSCSFRSIRGRTLVCAIFDEIAFWQSEGASPDNEILSAVRPGMATIPNSKLIVISSPYARRGVLYEHHRDYHGKEDPEILVWQAPTRVMNPTISQGLIDRESKKDPSAAKAEWGAQFREDIETFLTPEAIDACIVLGRRALPFQPLTHYTAFCDPSGGRHDNFSLAISHKENERLVVDLLRAWEPPFNPQVVVTEIIKVLKDYKISLVTGDRYAAAWVSSAFENDGEKEKSTGIIYQTSELAKSDLYLNFEATINTRQIELPEDEYLIKELCSLERRRGRSGKDSVDHPPRGMDDRANAVAGAAYEGFKYTDLIFHELLQQQRERRDEVAKN